MYTSLQALNPASRVEEAPVGCERWPAWGTRSASWRACVDPTHNESQAPRPRPLGPGGGRPRSAVSDEPRGMVSAR
jgi:hypothetical protein